MSTIAVLCIVALVAVAIVGVVGAFSSGSTSLDDVYARHQARKAVVGDVAPTDPWVTDARTLPELVPEQRTGSERTGSGMTAEEVVTPVQRQVA